MSANPTTVTFPTPFSSTPNLALTRGSGGYEHSVIVTSVSSTQFQGTCKGEGNAFSAQDKVYWIAAG